MKIPFYILGLLLRYGAQHGYRLKQIIEETVADFAKIKLPTIYYHLAKLEENGYVTATLDKDGNRPEKMVYQITKSGQKYYMELFVKQLKESYSPEFPLDGVLYFSKVTANHLLLDELERKVQEIKIKLDNLERHKGNSLSNIHPSGRYIAETIFEHHIVHFEAELKWLKNTIEGLSK